MKQDVPGAVWYRQPLVLMLIFLPASVVVASFVTLYLAIRSDDGLVEDDYYQRGKEINRVLDRDHAARRYGLHAQLLLEPARGRVTVRLAAASVSALRPARLELKLFYATRAGKDRVVTLLRTPDGVYQGVISAPGPGRWNVQLAAADWRLSGELRVPGSKTIELSAP